MTPDDRSTLIIILSVAVAAPLLAHWAARRVRLPGVVLEILLGILVGPHVLGWAHANHVIDAFAQFGMLLLFFAAGFEIDFRRIAGLPLVFGLLGWLASAGIALAIAYALEASGVVISATIVALAMTTTAVGTLLPMLRDAGDLETPFGRYVVAAGAIGEFAPIILMALVFEQGGVAHTGGLIALFGAVAFIGGLLASMAHAPRLIEFSRRMMNTSAQLPIRVALLVLAALVLLSRGLGLDTVLGAATAGIIVSLAVHADQREVMVHKLDGIGFGFFIPIFFVVSGIKFDLTALVATPMTILKVPVFLALFLLVRGLPALLLYRWHLPSHEHRAMALMSATQLPLIVAIVAIAVPEGLMHPENAAALVGAGMLSVLLFPVLAFRLRGGLAAKATEAAPVQQPEV